MASGIKVNISRSDLDSLGQLAKITDVRHLSSYSWIEGSTPTVIVPGLPPLWNPLRGPQKLERDSGFVYIAQNAARYPDCPIEPLFRSLFIEHPTFDLRTVDVISDRNNIRKLLQFARPVQSSHTLESFTINAEVTQNTTIFCRTEAATSEVIGPNDFRGFGHEFERRYTTAEISDSAGHHRILSFRFCGMSFVVRYETDGYVKTDAVGHEGLEGDSLTNLLRGLSLNQRNNSYENIAESKLRIQRGGQVVSPSSIIEIKTRTRNKLIDIDEIAPQLWASQTPKLVRAYHVRGQFFDPKVEDVAAKIQDWEANNQPDLMKLGWLIKKIISVAKKLGGKVVIKYDVSTDELCIHQNTNASNLLPKDLYARWTAVEAKAGGPETQGKQQSPQVNAGIMSRHHEREVRRDLPFATVLLSVSDKGFRQVFRDMPPNLTDYQSLCESFKASEIDVLQGRQVRDLMGDLKRGKEDWDTDEGHKISGCKTIARDAAFRLIYAFMQEDSGDGNAAYNATVFVVSHFRIFGYRIRKMVREAFEYKFTLSVKQRRELDKWPASGDWDEDDATTEDTYFDYWDSDDS